MNFKQLISTAVLSVVAVPYSGLLLNESLTKYQASMPENSAIKQLLSPVRNVSNNQVATSTPPSNYCEAIRSCLGDEALILTKDTKAQHRAVERPPEAVSTNNEPDSTVSSNNTAPETPSDMNNQGTFEQAAKQVSNVNCPPTSKQIQNGSDPSALWLSKNKPRRYCPTLQRRQAEQNRTQGEDETEPHDEREGEQSVEKKSPWLLVDQKKHQARKQPSSTCNQ